MNQNLKNIPQSPDTAIHIAWSVVVIWAVVIIWASAIVTALGVVVWGGCQPKTGTQGPGYNKSYRLILDLC